MLSSYHEANYFYNQNKTAILIFLSQQLCSTRGSTLLFTTGSEHISGLCFRSINNKSFYHPVHRLDTLRYLVYHRAHGIKITLSLSIDIPCLALPYSQTPSYLLSHSRKNSFMNFRSFFFFVFLCARSLASKQI